MKTTHSKQANKQSLHSLKQVALSDSTNAKTRERERERERE
ncbi:hypothetical protein [Helicobacter sp. T3_23-1059]